ncbi:uncharacterized protein KGF55_004048 [Candida pseudojiufengensis]|uniref:uncharacterized protein n=1 Tax=Candida pseudojiufengensis TaxID=497109 RepID=UPI002225843A|nr:uncharacterized protein KGF55_004048 [Candida pseudojiufengensis]KAI5961425.1 hypothetical protein KGF55_004048 [Candida pseudojiufengensis]
MSIPKVKKRTYSFFGCRECKRRKIKCNEGKPSCFECTRLNKQCSYPKIGEKVKRISKKELQNNVESTTTKPLNILMYNGPNKKKKKSDDKDDKKEEPQSEQQQQDQQQELYPYSGINSKISSKPFPHSNIRNPPESNIRNQPKPIQETNFYQAPSIETTQEINHNNDNIQNHTINQNQVIDQNQIVDPTSLLIGDVYNNDDLNLLATDLNNLVNDILFTSNMDQAQYNQDFFDPSTITTPFIDDIPKFIPVDFIKLKTNEEKKYLQEFYDNFAMQMLPFGAYDKFIGRYSNPIRDVIMKYATEPFLLCAVLSQGARLIYERDNDSQDFENYGNYLSTCLKLLGPALSRNKENLVVDVETILITVLLLASSNASTEKQSWRPHLKGAKDIILKATTKKSSTTITLCKLWFADFEILAGLSSNLGGTLQPKEIDLIFNFEDEFVQLVLKQFNLIQDNGFCVMTGYHLNSLRYLRNLSDLIRQECDSFNYLELINGFYQQYQITYISRDCKVDSTLQNQLTELMDTIHNPDGSITIISWMDISQQAFSLAGLITIFIDILKNPPESSHVKNLVSKLIGLLNLIENAIPSKMSFPFGFSMIQWPISVGAINCLNKSQFSLIEKFFRMCYDQGSYTANLTFEKIKKTWEMRALGVETKHDDGSKIDRIVY